LNCVDLVLKNFMKITQYGNDYNCKDNDSSIW
jgi:hypothetical protein